MENAIEAGNLTKYFGLSTFKKKKAKGFSKGMKRKLTIFLTTHNIEEANIMCDRVAIIVSGRIVAIDSPERLKRIIQVT